MDILMSDANTSNVVSGIKDKMSKIVVMVSSALDRLLVTGEVVQYVINKDDESGVVKDIVVVGTSVRNIKEIKAIVFGYVRDAVINVALPNDVFDRSLHLVVETREDDAGRELLECYGL